MYSFESGYRIIQDHHSYNESSPHSLDTLKFHRSEITLLSSRPLDMKRLVTNRLNNFRRVISDRGLDAIMLVNYTYTGSSMYSDYNILYLSNLTNRFDNSLFALTPDDYHLWIERTEFNRTMGETWLDNTSPADIAGWLMSPEAFSKKAITLLRQKIGKGRVKVGFNGQVLRGGVLQVLQRERDIAWVDISTELVRSRMVKDELEKRELREAGRMADIGVEAVMKNVREGVTELELEAEAEKEIRLAGAQGSWFSYGFGFVGFGPETADAVSGGTSPSRRKLKKGEIVTMDYTPFVNGYGADIARTFIFGRASPQQHEAFNKTKEVLDSQRSSLRGGMTVAQLRKATLRPLNGHHLAGNLTSFGHGIGLYDDVYPLFSPEFDDIVLPSGMAIATEPEVTIMGLGVLRLEDNFVLTDSGAERLTKSAIVESVS